MNVRSATAQDAAGIVALAKASNPHGDWYRKPHQKLGRTRYEELTPLERYLHGGFWMDLSLFRRHMHEYQSRGFPILIAEDAGKIVGECELWLDVEPEPFGRYAEVEMIESGTPPDPKVERALLEHAADRARKMGYKALDLCPEHSGGESVAAKLGFEPLWDTRTFEAGPKEVEKPGEEFAARYLAGDYNDLVGLLALNHREPARWRYEILTARWPAAEFAGLLDATRLVEMAVDAPDAARFSVIAARRAWSDPPLAEIDVWMDRGGLKSPKRVAKAFAIAAEIARRLEAKRIVTYAPPNAAKALRDIGFSGGKTPDEWLRWTF